jgi:ribulose-phosphate 3-epimerase
MTIIAPSILSANFARLASEIVEIEKAGADWIHVDVMDGHFVPNLTFGPLIVQSIREYTHLPFDVHLMISHPEDFIEDFVRAGANRITVHVETCLHLHRVLSMIKEKGVKAGVALNPATPLSFIESVIDEHLDLVLIMTVNPGFGGQTFIPSTLSKIIQLQKIRQENQYAQLLIEVDGGIHVGTAKSVVQAGADVLVAGQAIFGQSDRNTAIHQIRNACL